jgi:hypothetical protein
MKQLVVASLSSLCLCLFAASAFAAGPSCKEQATSKKLHGAAQTSFMKKCVATTCDASAKDKKLAGAAKTSFTKKCVSDQAG